MGTTEEVPVNLDAMADDSAFAVLANRGHRLDRTLEAVEDMTRTGRNNLEALVVIIAANFARGHIDLPRNSMIAL
jgi:hypothetical protein